MTRAIRPARFGVPAYFHPSWAGDDWARLTGEEEAEEVGIVVINPDTGPGARSDDAYRSVCASARGPDRCLAGYVDSGYGRRPVDDVVAEATAYAHFYGLDAVFVDQVTSGSGYLPFYRRLVAALRECGVEEVILNPGVPPDPGYREFADVVVEFEGGPQAYRRFTRCAPGSGRGRARRWHLVHGVPPAEHGDTIGRARRAGVDYVYVTDRTMPNPWDGLPSTWPDLLQGTDGWARRR